MKKFFVFLCGFAALIPTAALAHVGYVVNEAEFSEHSGTDWSFLLSPFSDPFYLSLMVLTAVVVIIIYFWLSKNKFFQEQVEKVEERTHTYYDLIGWMMRLGLGIALIGAGSANVFISPNLPMMPQFSILQILLGFFILAGFLVGPTTLAIIVLYFWALFSKFYILGNLDMLGLAVALLTVANAKPGVDDLLGVKFLSPLKSLRPHLPLILRIGIGGAMMFLAIYEKILNPNLSALVVTEYHLNSVIPVSVAMWVLAAGLIEFLVGFLLLIGFKTRLIVVVAFLVLSLSFFYFHEAVYSHVTLFATLSILFITGKKADGVI